MEEILLAKTIIALIGGVIFALYDVFNKRTIPDKVAYSFFAISLILTFFNELQTIEISLLVASLILAFGYLLYKQALLGLGDVLELASISLILPIFQPLIPSNFERFVKLPFFVTLFLNSGIFAVVLVALWIPFKIKKKQEKKGRAKLLSILIFLLYLLVALLLKDLLSEFGIFLVNLLGISASLLIFYKEDFKENCLKVISIKELGIGDIIQPIPELGNERLVTKELIEKLKKKRIKKVKVYYNLPPFSLFILLGLISGIVFGNILFWIVKF
ncbi:MAG: prepilin peptidase [Candidatus Micrarchaeia archaeon]